VTDLSGRRAVVTGGASGIGEACARALAAGGAHVVIADLNGEAALRVAAELGGEAWQVDLGDTAALAELSLDADILVNNAGIQHVSPIEQFPVEKWDAVIAINLSSAFHTTRLALPAMRRNGWGRIVNVASAHGLVGSPFKAAYVAAKHGILGLTKVIALETAQENITCNAICPGYVWTPLVEAQIEGQAKSHGIPREQVIKDVLLAQQPNKRFATVEEIGALSVFLASEGAASITGTALPVDGGWTAH